MGITGELVKSVFSRKQVKSNAVDKKRWSSVRSYLCGDEFDSVLAEEDSVSVKNSEAPTIAEQEDTQFHESKEEEDAADKKQNSMEVLFREQDAAIVIQTAFRDFLARRPNEGIQLIDVHQGNVARRNSPSRESMGTSLEVQTDNSVDLFSVRDGTMHKQHRIQQKVRTQSLRLKEDWDDSTLSSNISKMRIQNRLEATTRRERALAYAFSQQLRICSKKKQTRFDGTEQNMGWSWLERWMATRHPESPWVENHISNQQDTNACHQEFTTQKLFSDYTGEEKESCGSNEVSVQFSSFSSAAQKQKDGFKPTRSRLKAARNVSKRKTMPNHQLPREYDKANDNECSGEPVKGKRQKLKPPRSNKESEYKTASD